MTYSNEGLEMTKFFEGLRLKAYQDEGGVPTIGYGHTAGVKEGDTCTQEQADAWLEDDLNWAAVVVKNFVKVRLTDDQRAALIDFVFNVGAGNFMHSTLLKKLNAGDYQGAAAEFSHWNKVNGKVSKGLTARRLAEQKMFRGEPWR